MVKKAQAGLVFSVDRAKGLNTVYLTKPPSIHCVLVKSKIGR